MFYPVAVDGKMPFVDQNAHRDQQIKKVIQKHRAKRHRDSFKTDNTYAAMKNSNNERLHRRTPLIEQNDLINTSSDLSLCASYDSSPKFSKNNILHSIKQWFTSAKTKSTDSIDSAKSPYKPKFQQRSTTPSRLNSEPVNIECRSSRKKARESSANSPPGVSAKRQRTRTVSHMSSVMETIIEEVPCEECVVLPDSADTDSSHFGSAISSLSDLITDSSPSTSQIHSTESLSSLSDHYFSGGVLLDS